MKIALLEPFFTGSHLTWAKGYQHSSQHDVEIFSLPGRHWKWRMHGGAVSLANQFMESNCEADFILATDMLDLAVFLGLTKNKTSTIPVGLYFHENQLTYPWSETDPDVKLKRDNHYAFINYTSALAANQIFFNSQYHLDSFISSLPNFLSQFPDFKSLENVEKIKAKSQVLHLGMQLNKFDAVQLFEKNNSPTILWNHRWEYDKQPDLFFETLFRLKEESLSFQLIVLGESYHKVPPIFAQAKTILADEIIHFGYTEKYETYNSLLQQADLLPVTSIQDFFGGSVVEAIYCGCYPLLPNRLAYPEHLPSNLHESYFYNSNSDFYPQLKSILTDERMLNNFKGLKSHVAKYDWELQSTIYDQLFQSISFPRT